MSADEYHRPVMVEEVLGLLDCRPGGIWVDATLGGGGHAAAILQASAPDGFLIGIDRDREALARAREALDGYRGRFILRHGNFGALGALLREVGRPKVHGLLLDLGISSWQVDRVERGFSFRGEAPLDMRMDRSEERDADRLIRESREDDLAAIIRQYGEEKRARRIAAAVKEAAARNPRLTTVALASAIEAVLGGRGPRRGKIHPATRTFQALRIAVNSEIDALGAVLRQVPEVLHPGGRCCCIAYHSLEDRMVKNAFRDMAGRGVNRQEATLELLTRKPLRPAEEEVSRNPRARSARLRAVRRKEAA